MKKLSTLFCVVACFTMIFSVSAFANKANTMGTQDMTQNMSNNNLNTASPGNMNKNNTNTVPNAINRAAQDVEQAGRDIARPLTNTNNGYRTNGVNDGYRTNGVNDGYRAYNTNNGYRNNNMRANNYNAKATTGGSNWGWLGLLGLIGLAGMRSKDRERN